MVLVVAFVVLRIVSQVLVTVVAAAEADHDIIGNPMLNESQLLLASLPPESPLTANNCSRSVQTADFIPN